MKTRGQAVMGGERGFDLLCSLQSEAVGSAWSVPLPAAAYSVYAPSCASIPHPSPFIMLHMGDTGLN